MVFILKSGTSESGVRAFAASFEAQGFSTIVSVGTEHTAVCLIGNTANVDMDRVVELSGIVQYARRVTEQYKAAGRTVHPEDTVVEVGSTQVGPGTFSVIAGPCAVESEAQIVEISRSVKASGATMLRGGAFKPRTSPYSFQGLGGTGLKLLLSAKRETGLPVVSEIMTPSQARLFEDIDAVQIGARNMQTFDLLKEVGMMNKPVILKRGLSSAIEELLMSAEYILASGTAA
jgi:3-deoxy-7-phosphoheptulonate synthase